MVVRLKKIKNIINSKNAMIIISAVIMLILLISATIAWFVLSRDARIDLFSNKISEWDFVVSDTPGGPPISEDTVLKFNVDEFINVTSGVMAPGTSGSIDLYLRTSTDVVTEYALFLDNAGLRLDAYSDNATTDEEIQAEKDANSEMLRNHIRFYQDAEHTKELSMTEPIKGELKPNEEVKVSIYWYWLYDGNEAISSEMIDEDESQAVLRKWDLNDNFISDNLDKISGTIDISVFATQQRPVKASSGDVSSDGQISSGGQLADGE